MVMSFGVSALILGLGTVTGIALARELGPQDRGALAAIVLWPTILVSIGSLGLPDALAFFVARQTQALSKVVGTAAALVAVLALLLTGVGAVLVPLVSQSDANDHLGQALIYLAFIPLYMPILFIIWILNGLQKFGLFQLIRLALFGGHAFGILLLVVLDEVTIRSVVMVYLVVYAALALVSIAILLRESGRHFEVSTTLARSLLHYGLRSHLGNTSSLLNERLDQLMISLFLAPISLGLYVAAVTLTSFNQLLGSAVASVSLPSISRLNDHGEQVVAVRRFLRITAVAALAFALPMTLLVEPALQLFFGGAFSGAAPACRILIPASAVLAVGKAATSSLRGLGRPSDAGMSDLVGVATTFGALALLLPTLGITGAAIASLLAYAVSAFWALRRLSVALDCSVSGLFLPSGEPLK